MNNSTLLIWEDNPDNIVFYLIPNEVADKYRMQLEEAHGTYITFVSENDATRFVFSAISEYEYDDDYVCESLEATHGIFKSYKLEGASPIIGANINSVYLVGCVWRR